MTAIISVGIWGWYRTDGFLQYLLAFGLPILIATIWGVFAVPNDPSRSGKTVVATPGSIRLFIELGIFSSAAFALFDLGKHQYSYIFGAIVIVHYLVSYDRIIWLFNPNSSKEESIKNEHE
jgi:hypothetical protein